MPSQYRFVTLDVFTATRYAGNPLAVVFLPSPDSLTQEQKQAVAHEFDLSETIFVYDSLPPEGHPNPGHTTTHMSIFTSWREILFAGHPTIGAASWLLVHDAQRNSNSASTGTPQTPKQLLTRAGVIPIALAPTPSQPAAVRLTVPQTFHQHAARVPLSALLPLHPGLAGAFANTTSSSISSGSTTTALPTSFPIVSIVHGMTFILVAVPVTPAGRAVFAALAPGPISAAISAADTAASGGYLDEGWTYDAELCVYFYMLGEAPEVPGTVHTRLMVRDIEDPATGSAASALCGFLALQEWKQQAPQEGSVEAAAAAAAREWEFRLLQGEDMGRRSEIGVRVRLGAAGESKSMGIERVELSGEAVVVQEGLIWA